MANQAGDAIPGWTERWNTDAVWVGDESTDIYCDQSDTGKGGVITRDSTGVLEKFTFTTNVKARTVNGTAGNGGIIFCCNADSTEYYCITWKINWGGGADLYVQDSSTALASNVIFTEHTPVNLLDGTYYNIQLTFDNTTGDIELLIDGTESHTNTIPTPYNAGYIGYGGVNSWEEGNIWEYSSIIDNDTPTTRRRVMIIS